MPDAAEVRKFNRYYSERLGLLADRYLGQARPLAQARLLFEIGAAGASVRTLRHRLSLDSGYLSRLLRALESQRLVSVQRSDTDGRVRVARLTGAGREELAELDRRSQAAAAALLASLAAPQRQAVVAAMGVVRRTLSEAEVEVKSQGPDTEEARTCLRAYAHELAIRFPEGYEESSLLPPEALSGGRGVLLIARRRGRVVGCGCVTQLTARTMEIRHLWVAPQARGVGVGRRLLSELERWALSHGGGRVRLDTHRELKEAIQLYRANGYLEVPAYNRNPHAHHWFEKRLDERLEGARQRRLGAAKAKMVEPAEGATS